MNRRDFLRASAAASSIIALGSRAQAFPADPLGTGEGQGRSTVAGVLFVTAHGAAPRVAARLVREPGVTLAGGDGDSRLAAICEAPDGASLDALSERLRAQDPDILGILPTFLGQY